MRFIALFSLLPLACQASAQAPTPAASVTAAPAASGVVAGPSMESDPTIVATILKLMEGNLKVGKEEAAESVTRGELQCGSPQCQLLFNRYSFLGIPLSEALTSAKDPRLEEQLLELARWRSSGDEENVSRPFALVALAGRREPQDGKIFNEALNHPDIGVRFASLEALQVWNKDPDVKQMLQYVIRSDARPIMKIYAAQALLRRGGEEGRTELLRQLDSGDAIARAMAARYLGELGKGEDYELLLGRIDREQQTDDYTLAEYAIACLKLFPKKTPTPSAPPPPGPIPVAAGEDEFEPLVITAPRLKIPATALIDGRINSHLLRLLENQAPPKTEKDNPSRSDLGKFKSATGVRLNFRYNNITFLLTEGLAGASDLLLRDRVMKVARQLGNDPNRAAALLAIAYNHDIGDRGLFDEALVSQKFLLRFSAVEALQVWNRQGAMQAIANVARMDFSPFLQVYAAGVALRNGDPAGRDILIRHFDDPDWVVRSLVIRYLGELGIAEDYPRIMFQLDREPKRWVRAEMAGALLRLNRLRPR